jgi:hypothetical protein
MVKKLFLFLIASLFLVSLVSAAGTFSNPSYCCEKTIDGANCINAEEAQCDPQFKKTPSSCESTSYCKTGTCYDSQEGICMDNTPQRTCQENGGSWDEREAAEIPQCQLGCCVIADQAAFVPLVRCKRLSTLFGVQTDYRTNILSEVQCIATAQSQDVGACVYEEDFEKNCEFTTRGDCNAQDYVEVANKTDSVSTGKKFYKDYLCSAEELGTVCARQVSTECYQGKVYWTDSCGNRENIYSSDKEKSWNNGMVLDADKVCAPNGGTEKDCGNCEYLLGARCGDAEGLLNQPTYGDLKCKTTKCVDRDGNERKNGESWCVFPAEERDTSDAVGSRYFREICIDGEVQVEPCEDFRNEVCIQGAIETSDGEFSAAACRVNRWQDCVLQMEQDDCENIDRRDCKWIESVDGLVIGAGSSSSSSDRLSGTTKKFSNPTTGMVSAPITGNAFLGMGGDDEKEEELETITNRPDGICVPAFAPGFEFWEDGDAAGICSQASAQCIVTYEKGLIGGGWECVDGCECLDGEWAMQVNKICTSIGDCGAGTNYKGTYTDDGYSWTKDGKKQEFSTASQGAIKSSITGFATAPAYMINENLKLNSGDYVYVKTN